MSKVPLHYEAQQPAFLRRLKAGFGESDGRNNVQHARPNKSRLKMSADDSDEDNPVILDEHGEIVRKEELESRLKDEKDGEAKDATEVDAEKGKTTDTTSTERDQQRVAAIGGASRKRKFGKIVGEEAGNQDANDETDSVTVKSMSKATKDLASVIKDSTDAAKKDAEDQKTKSEALRPDSLGKKKKAKKIKLSFDDPD